MEKSIVGSNPTLSAGRWLMAGVLKLSAIFCVRITDDPQQSVVGDL
jgi:hypothetical protein